MKRTYRLLLLAALGMTAALVNPVEAQDIGLQIGSVAPVAQVETLDGKTVDLGEYVGKKPALIEFWATWCGNCAQLEPTMKAMHEKYGSRVAFIGVAVSINQSPARVKAYAEKHGLPWIQLFDRKGEATGSYDVPATSYVVVIDKAGKIVYTGLGGKQNLESALEKAVR
jgi:thiol-disulfide isomerase/thioredoxin